MGKVICIANQKGGVGKTTTCVNLGIALAMAGKRVCLIDSDPQGSLTESLGYRNPDEMENSQSGRNGEYPRRCTEGGNGT